MFIRYGASPADWKLLVEEGLTPDLLPVVSNPNFPISSKSALKQTGKVPSVLTKTNEIVGLSKWTQRETSKDEAREWAANGDYGICVQTRRLRAFDVDVMDAELADRIADTLAALSPVVLPCRSRSGSSKRLFAFYLEGEYGKRVVQVGKDNNGANQMVEFLANGQQFIAFGTHPSGVRYDWSGLEKGGGPVFPTLSENQFEAIWFALCEDFAVEAASEKGIRQRGDHVAISDYVADYLWDNQLVLGEGNDGQLFIECPFKDGHSSETSESSTSYLPAGTNGYDVGSFCCLHASCSHRSQAEFLDAYGLRTDGLLVEFGSDSQGSDGDAGLEDDENAVNERGVIGALPPFARNKNGEILATLDNIIRGLERPDISGHTVRYDNFVDEILLFDRKGKNAGRLKDTDLVNFRRRLEALHGYQKISRELIRDAVSLLAVNQEMDSAIEWVESLRWDGTPRVERFVHERFGCEDSDYATAVSKYMWTALAGRALSPGCKVDMVPVLISPEGYAKSTSVAAIAPTPDQFVEIDMSERDADLARRIRGKLIAEISELRGLRSRDEESILAYITRQHEEWVPKYKEFSTSFPRRLVFVATTNETEFLSPERGNRRWLPLFVREMLAPESIARDRNQLWAEAVVLYKKNGVMWREAHELAEPYRRLACTQDPWAPLVAQWLSEQDLEDIKLEHGGLFLHTIAEYVLGISAARFGRKESHRLGRVMKVLGYKTAKKNWSATKQNAYWHYEKLDDRELI